MRRFLLISAVLAIAGVAATLSIGGRLAAPTLHTVGPPPRGLPAETVELASGNGPVRGWFIPGEPGRSAVLLLHALRTDRRAMLGRARFLHRAGYTVLMIDLQAHGESPGENITFGYREAEGVTAAARYLKNRLPGERLGVIGVSLGGVAALQGAATLSADVLVLEAVYPTLRRAVENRIAIRLGNPGRLLAPLLLWQVGPRLGFDPDALSPAARIAKLDKPVLIVGGSDDRHTTPDDTRTLFARAHQPKSLWIVGHAGHQDFHTFAPKQYEKRILDFFMRYLDRPENDTAP